jgi:replication-associated recombination protein RarA
MAAVQETRNDPVPLHLRNAVTGLMRGMGYGRGYRYSHDFAEDDPERWTQQYLPDNVAGRRFYAPGDQGFEASEIAARVERIRRLREGGVDHLNPLETSTRGVQPSVTRASPQDEAAADKR